MITAKEALTLTRKGHRFLERLDAPVREAASLGKNHITVWLPIDSYQEAFDLAQVLKSNDYKFEVGFDFYNNGYNFDLRWESRT